MYAKCRISPLTGGNAGIGKETVKVLLSHNAKVYLAARSASKANAAIAELKAETGKEAIFLQLDLSDIPAVRKSAKEFLSYAQYHPAQMNSRLIAKLLSERRISYTSLSTMRKW